MQKEEEKALRYNDGKPEWSLVHYESILPLVRVLEFGARKYDRDNWKKPMDKKKILESAMRHIAAMMDGEDVDNESGELHAGHVLCNMMFWIYQNNHEPKQSLEKF